jgi:hypothetical protein
VARAWSGLTAGGAGDGALAQPASHASNPATTGRKNALTSGKARGGWKSAINAGKVFSERVARLGFTMHNDEWTIDIDDWTYDFPGPKQADHDASNEVREPPPDIPRRDELPGTEDDVDPEDGGGRIEKRT